MWSHEKSPHEESSYWSYPHNIRPKPTKPNLTTLSRAMYYITYPGGGLSGPALSPIFDVKDF